jgi:hypothetical protein
MKLHQKTNGAMQKVLEVKWLMASGEHYEYTSHLSSYNDCTSAKGLRDTCLDIITHLCKLRDGSNSSLKVVPVPRDADIDLFMQREVANHGVDERVIGISLQDDMYS